MSKLKLFGTTSHSFIQAAPTSSGETFTLPGEGASNPGLGGMYLSTPKAANSTSILFDDVPVWAKKITIMFQGVSVSVAVSDIRIRLGTSGGIISTGYLAVSTNIDGTNTNSTTHFIIRGIETAYVNSGHYTITKFDSSTYIGTGLSRVNTSAQRYGSGELTGVSGIIDRVEISAGSAYNAGQINILYEG